jgi:hypothetical protein
MNLAVRIAVHNATNVYVAVNKLPCARAMQDNPRGFATIPWRGEVFAGENKFVKRDTMERSSRLEYSQTVGCWGKDIPANNGNAKISVGFKQCIKT